MRECQRGWRVLPAEGKGASIPTEVRSSTGSDGAAPPCPPPRSGAGVDGSEPVYPDRPPFPVDSGGGGAARNGVPCWCSPLRGGGHGEGSSSTPATPPPPPGCHFRLALPGEEGVSRFWWWWCDEASFGDCHHPLATGERRLPPPPYFATSPLPTPLPAPPTSDSRSRTLEPSAQAVRPPSSGSSPPSKFHRD